MAVLAFQILGLRNRHLQNHGEVVSKVRAAHRNRGRVGHRPLKEDRQVTGVGADIQEADAQFALVGRERAFGRGDRLKYRL